MTEIRISILALTPARHCYRRKTPVKRGVAERFTVGLKMVRVTGRRGLLFLLATLG